MTNLTRAGKRIIENSNRNHKAASPQAKFVKLISEVNASLIDRQEEIDLTATAMVAYTTLLLVGPPGSGKSFTLESLLSAFGKKPFIWVMGKFTEPDEIFGPPDITAMMKGKRARITTGKLPEAEAAFLDEFWNSSTAIANALLRITNERKFDNGEGDVDVPLKTLVAASNRYPEEGETNAMYDRFVLRKDVDYVKSADSRRKLLMSMTHKPNITVSLTTGEWDKAHEEAMNLVVPDEVWVKAGEILEACIAQGIHPSDRRLPLVGRIIRAYAYISGAKEVKKDHLGVLQHMLWNVHTDADKVRSIIARIANPLNMQVNAFLLTTKDVMSKAAELGWSEAAESLRDISNKLEHLEATPYVMDARKYVSNCREVALKHVNRLNGVGQ